MMTINTLIKTLVIATFMATAVGCTSTPTRESTDEHVDNTVIPTKVKTALAKDSLGTLLEVEVVTFRDVVQLSGFVDSEADKVRAEDIAAGIEGAASVDNSLIVKE